MRTLRYLCMLMVAVGVFSGPAFAGDADDAINGYLAAISEGGTDMASGCEKKLNDQGTGSTCSCTAAGSGATCICSGSGSSTVCSCTDSTGTTYCYYCGGGTSNCECGPTNRSGQPCLRVTMAIDGQVAILSK